MDMIVADQWNIREARVDDECELAEMRALLWPDGSFEEHLTEVQGYLEGRSPGTLPHATFVAEHSAGGLAGFIEVGLRSHADGCNPAQPVGFIEGWFVRQASRGKGTGRALVQAAEEWSRANGCVEMASDALIDNAASHHAHSALGFEVVDRCVHFKKNL